MPITPNTIEALCVLLLELKIAFDYEDEFVRVTDPEAAQKTFISARFSNKYKIVTVLQRVNEPEISVAEAVRILAAYKVG